MRSRSRSRSRQTPPSEPIGGGFWLIIILLIGGFIRLAIPLPPLPAFLWLGLLVGSCTVRYPKTRTRSEDPDPKKLAAFKRWKTIQSGLKPNKQWLTVRRIAWWMGLALGLLVSNRMPLPLTLANIVFTFMSVQGITYWMDRRKDARHKYEGVSIPVFFTHAGWKRISASIAIGVLLVIATIRLFMSGTVGWQSLIAMPATGFLLAVWMLGRKAQSAKWRRLLDMQSLLDGWCATSGLQKAYPSVYVTQVNDIPGANDQSFRVIRFRIQDENGNPYSNTAACRLGIEPIRALAAPAGYGYAQLLGARRKGSGFEFDRSAMRLVLASNETVIPSTTDPKMSEKTVSLIADIAYQYAGDLWHKRAPLVKAHNVSDDPARAAWLLELFDAPENGCSKDLVALNWLADESESPARMLGMPVFSDLTNQWHLAADPSTRLNDKGNKYRQTGVLTSSLSFDYYIKLSRRYKHDMLLMQDLLGSKLPHPVIEYDNTRPYRSMDGNWRIAISPLQGMEPATPADYAGYDLSGLSNEAMSVTFIEGDTTPVMVETFGQAPTRIDHLDDNHTSSKLLAKTIIFRALVASLPNKSSIHIMSCTQECRSNAIWRVKFQVFNGATIADVRRHTANIAAAAGAAHVYLKWESADIGILWLTGRNTMLDLTDMNQWIHRSSRKELIKLVLSNAWAVAGVYDSEGRNPTVVNLGTLPRNKTVLMARFEVPGGISVDKPKDNIAKYLTEADYMYGRILPRGDEHGARQFDMLLSKHSPFPTMVKADWEESMHEDTRMFPMGVDDRGELVYWSLKETPHIIIEGKSGSGKSSAIQIVVAEAMLRGGEIILIDPMKGCMDFTQWAKPRALSFVGVEQMRETEATVAWAHEEMRVRKDLNTKYKVGDIYELNPEDVDPEDRVHLKPLYIIFDEFNSYLGKQSKTTSNPNHDINIANANAKIDATNNSIKRTMGNLADIAVQGRTLAIHLILGAQRVGITDFEPFQNGKAFFKSTGRMLLGNDTTPGVISQQNESEANRLQRQLGGSGAAIPRGRGLYESADGQLNAVQTWYSGGQEALSELVEHIPTVKPVDISRYMPKDAEQFGAISQEDLRAELRKAKDDENADSAYLAQLFSADSDEDGDTMTELEI